MRSKWIGRTIVLWGGALVVLHLVASFWLMPFLWGVHQWAFFSGPIRLLFAALGLSLCVPGVQRGIASFFARAARPSVPWLRDQNRYAVYGAISLCAAALFWIFRTRTHFLGDGYLLITALSRNTPRFRNEPLSLWLIDLLHRMVGYLGGSAEVTYTVVSCFSGFLFVFFALLIAEVLGRRTSERVLVFLVLVTLGTVQLFCGYVEHYALFEAGVMGYLFLSVRLLRSETAFPSRRSGSGKRRAPSARTASRRKEGLKYGRHLSVLALVLGLIFSLHFFGIALYPSFLLLAIWTVRRASSRGTLRVVSVALLPFAIALLILTAIGLDFQAYLARFGQGSHLLSLFEEPDFMRGYRMLSLGHLSDLVNAQLLVSPFGLLLCGVFLWGHGRRIVWKEPVLLYLIAASLFPLLLTVVLNPEIGAFRDWDLLSLPSILYSTLGVYLLVRYGSPSERLTRTGVVVCGIMVLHTVPWILVNADEGRALARFETILRHLPWSGRTRSYGMETLGSYYAQQRQFEAAIHAFEGAIEAEPRNVRHWINLGNAYKGKGVFKETLFAYMQAVKIDSTYAEGYFNLGNTYKNGKFLERAIKEYRKALQINPNYLDARINLGSTYKEFGLLDEAIQEYQAALRIDPDRAEIYYNLGTAYREKRRYDEAIRSYRAFIKRWKGDPRYIGVAEDNIRELERR